MTLAAGTRLGVYEIVDALGAGGMGEVYRARDTRLRREVAIKILPESVAADPDRTARFQREAELLAALNHPNIAAIYGVEESTGATAIVMELVAGETLADIIARGALPVDEALAIAWQIADALEAAHDRGVIHRDLKPANIKLTPEGKVKVLDFGLAKVLEGGASGRTSGGLTMSPTLSVHATYAGIILGTAAYMSPEQARGKPVDRRADIWAFGCVVYEMLTGRQTFEAGETVSDAVAAVLKSDVDWRALPASTPPHVVKLLRRCLQKDPQKRLPHIGVVRLELDEPHADVAETAASRAAGRSPYPLWLRAMAVAAAAAVVAAVAATLAWTLKPPARSGVTRFTIPLPEGQQFTNTGRRLVSVAPDGSRFVYVASVRLFLHTFADDQVRPIQGSETVGGVANPTFSPDGQSIAFYAVSDRTLKRIPVNGGAPVTLGPSGNPFDVSWEGEYVYSGEGAAGIQRVPARGGAPETVVKVQDGELAHGPHLLPDGDTLLFTISAAAGGIDRWDKSRIVAQSMRTGVRTTLIEGGSDGRYLPTGHLIYALGGALMAVPFDAAHLRVLGGPTSVLEGVRRTTPTPAAHVSISNAGTAVYVTGPSATGQQDLVLFDRTGKTELLKIRPGAYEFPRFSPDGRQVAFGSDDGRDAAIWTYDLSGSTQPQRLTQSGRSRYPVWSADGSHVIFQSDRDGALSLYSQPADGSGSAVRLTTPTRFAHIPESVSPDGKFLLFAQLADTGATEWIYSFADGKIAPVQNLHSPVLPSAVFSPDGRWIAYASSDNATSSFRVYLQAFPPTGTTYEVAGGSHPVYSPDGTEILFSSGVASVVNAVKVATRPTVAFGNPTSFFRPILDVGPQSARPFDIRRDGWLIGVTDVTTSGTTQPVLARAPEMRVITNWFEELTQRVPVK